MQTCSTIAQPEYWHWYDLLFLFSFFQFCFQFFVYVCVHNFMQFYHVLVSVSITEVKIQNRSTTSRILYCPVKTIRTSFLSNHLSLATTTLLFIYTFIIPSILYKWFKQYMVLWDCCSSLSIIHVRVIQGFEAINNVFLFIAE